MSISIQLPKKQVMQIHSAMMEAKKQKLPQTPRRERSRSRSRDRKIVHLSKKKTKRVFREQSLHLEKHMQLLRPLVPKRETLRKQMSLAKAGYFEQKDSKVDISAMQKELDNLDKEIDLVRSAFRSGIGNTPIKRRCPQQMRITTAVTTGITNIVTFASSSALDPTGVTEWVSLSLLFDEYKVESADFEFEYHNVNSDTSCAANPSNCVPVIGVDPADNTISSSSMNTMERAHHKVLTVPHVATVSQVGSIPVSTTSVWHRWHYKVPPGILDGASNSAGAGSQWVAIGQPLKHGYCLFYHIGTIIVAHNSGNGIMTMNMEFRCTA